MGGGCLWKTTSEIDAEADADAAASSPLNEFVDHCHDSNRGDLQLHRRLHLEIRIQSQPLLQVFQNRILLDQMVELFPVRVQYLTRFDFLKLSRDEDRPVLEAFAKERGQVTAQRI